MSEAEKIIRKLLKQSHITINGKSPWDIQVHDPRTYGTLMSKHSIGLGETYMDGWWDSDQLDETIARIMRSGIDKSIQRNLSILFFFLTNKLVNIAGKNRAFIVGKRHYDIGNELYELMLDPDMNYSCGYWKDLGDPETAWKNTTNLAKAQHAKLDLICRKLYLKKGMSVLDIGCGWGNFAKYAAQKYGVSVVGITVSKEQANEARKRCKGLPVTIKLMDYRDLGKEQFDRVVSIGMVEHVTHKNYDTFMQVAQKSLKKEGLFLLHTIGSSRSITANDPWNAKYIFPNSHVPSLMQLSHASEKKFVTEDVHNFGIYYYPTLMSWYRNFDRNWKKLQQIDPEKYNIRFYRMWKFYLLSCAGAFKSRNLQLYQIVFSNKTGLDDYQAIR